MKMCDENAILDVVCKAVFIVKIAGEGNRTPVCSLGSCRSAIELHPRGCFPILDFRLPIATETNGKRTSTFHAEWV